MGSNHNIMILFRETGFSDNLVPVDLPGEASGKRHGDLKPLSTDSFSAAIFDSRQVLWVHRNKELFKNKKIIHTPRYST